MHVFQQEIILSPKTRGFHLIEDEILPKLSQIKEIEAGILHLFLKHTSASLALGENADASVRVDLENYFNDVVDENKAYFTHTYEGKDDMPAHIKSIMIGVSLSLPITEGRLNLGTWQGIYLNEHRNHGGRRVIVATIYGY
ncbi:MAG: secondary thiamine-phosphate synthase enzyme YjbQ [Epsilonproteobacteria bacterium]|nr:secondary thiamine-phosphate synthase enzyme YjbQ [Campylobacterota bacterium]